MHQKTHKLRWCVRNATTGRFVFCEVVSPQGEIVSLFCLKVEWENRHSPLPRIAAMQYDALQHARLLDTLISIYEGTHDDR
jgi:hypothetical protein